MRIKYFILSTSLLLLLSCHHQKSAEKQAGVSSCIQKAIDAFSKGSCDKLNVKEYTFQGKEVFLFDQGQCGNDMTSEVFDSNCKSLGLLGGFAGNVKINGEDFSNAVFVKTVWEK